MYKKYRDSVEGVADTALSLVYPRRCPVCDEVMSPIEIRRRGGAKSNDLGKPDFDIHFGRLIHDECHRKIRYVRGATCMKCGKGLSESESDCEYCSDCRKVKHLFRQGFSVFEYRSMAGSVYKFKYLGRKEYADFYAAAAKRVLFPKIKRLGIEAVIPVPMYKEKENLRGYNQAQVLAKKVAAELGIPCYTNVIERRKNTTPMKELDTRGRRQNLKKAFNITRNDVKFKCILIIDDIYTTGSTIDEITHEFQIAGVKDIYFLSLAIGQTT